MSASTPTNNRGQQRNRLPIDPHLSCECVAASEPSSAHLSCHSEEKHFCESRCPAGSHFGHFSESDRAVCTPQKLEEILQLLKEYYATQSRPAWSKSNLSWAKSCSLIQVMISLCSSTLSSFAMLPTPAYFWSTPWMELPAPQWFQFVLTEEVSCLPADERV